MSIIYGLATAICFSPSRRSTGSDGVNKTPVRAGLLLSFMGVVAYGGLSQATPTAGTSAWYDHAFHVDSAGVIGRSAIVLERPNRLPSEAMPLGNGNLGAAVWSADGMTIQLNRIDTLPRRLSPGQLTLPALQHITQAADYRGVLDLYNGEFRESGGGMTATVYVQPGSDLLVVDVTGADPKAVQTADLFLWSPRHPAASLHGSSGVLEEAWRDDREPGASGRRFGSIAALTAEGREVHVAPQDARTLRLSFTPKADGSFRVLVASPAWDEGGSTETAVAKTLAARSVEVHQPWWHGFWQRAGLIRVDSADGSGEYLENLRHLYLYTAAAERGTEMPGSQAGVGDLFSSVRDVHRWDPAAFWHLNLRMQIAANLGAGLPELNAAYFRLYRDNLQHLQGWTKERMGRPGICLPETMRFNGVGIEYETSGATPSIGLNCDAGSKPFFNARTLSTGAEVALWVWQQYLQTRDLGFLEQNYPLMREAALFLMAYEQKGTDGRLHTSPSNAHETQWDVLDPVTDLSARRTLYDETVQAATLLRRDAALVTRLRAEQSLIPELPRTGVDGKTLASGGADADRASVIAESAKPDAPQRNVENIGLEPVWPYGLIGDDSPETALARRTFEHRPYQTNQDWSFDPVQAARLGLRGDVAQTLVKLTETYQAFPNGLANWGGGSGEFYVEQSGVTALALQEVLVQDYDGLLRIAPALPPGWDFAGTVAIRDGARVHVQTKSGVVQVCVIEAGKAALLRVRDPWPGESFSIRDDSSGQRVREKTGEGTVEWQAVAGHAYVLERSGQTGATPGPTPLGGQPNLHARHLGTRQLGLSRQ